MYKHKWVSNYKLALAMGTCHRPLQGLNHVLLQLLALNPPEKTSGWKAEMRPPVLSIDRYFQVTILWGRFLYFLISRKSTKILHGEDCSLWLAESFTILADTFWKNMCLIAWNPSSPKSDDTHWPSPLPLWSSFSDLSEGLSPRLQSSFCPSKT